MISPQHMGGLFALSSAFLWALSAVLFRKAGDDVSPEGLNMGKGIIAIVCLGAVLCCTGSSPVPRAAYLLLGVSGVLSIAAGDTLYFHSLVRIGPRRILVISTLIPVLVLIFSTVFLHERLSPPQWLGVLAVLGGVILVLRERTTQSSDEMNSSGVWYGLASALCYALAVMLSKVALFAVSALSATFIRYLWGVGVLVIWGTVQKRLAKWVAPLACTRVLISFLPAAFFGTFLGTWCSQAGLKFADASIATILNSTMPIFVLPMVVLFLKERLNLRAVLGAVTAVCGVALLFANSP